MHEDHYDIPDDERADHSATVDLLVAFPTSLRVTAAELKVGDAFFDTFGGTHEIVEITRRNGWVTTVRDDGWEDRLHRDDLITISRSA